MAFFYVFYPIEEKYLVRRANFTSVENESDGRFDSRFDSNEKKRFAGSYYTTQLPDP